MKLKNKLLPFVGIAALGATFAPIALTSCGSKSSSNGVDLREWYTPTIEKHAYATLTNDEVKNLYFCGDETAEWGDWLDEDEMNERLTQDYLFGSSLWVQYISSNTKRSNLYRAKSNYADFNTVSAARDYFNLLGIDNVVGMESKQVEAKEKAYADYTVNYSNYNVAISDVRISHATDYSGETSVEVPTISFQLEFDIDYTGNVKSSGDGLGISISKDPVELAHVVTDLDDLRYGSSTTTQNHKGSITVVNVPICLNYSYCYEIGTYGWTMMFDAATLAKTELSTRIPFAIYGTDNVTYNTEAQLNDRDQNFSGTKVYSFDYYSNMIWENEATASVIVEATENAAKAYEDRYKEAEEEAKKEHPTWTEEQIEEYATAEANKASTEAFNELVIPSGVKNVISEINDELFETVSYYLLSVACK